MNTATLATAFALLTSLMGPAQAEQNSSQNVEFLNNAALAARKLPFSEAVRVGNILFLSGQIGFDSKSGQLVAGGIKAETRQTMTNISNTLQHHGYAMSDIVKCTVMLADISEWQLFNEVYVEYFSAPYPARSAFAATGLAYGARVEVECIAAVN